ncbi:MFS transporter [Actinocorallia longicatena]|uniref:MFS transporter n=1 Tax=Actinocorallia longicatena TaxID=111803 RepID=A0ABP6QGH1_9ACTN
MLRLIAGRSLAALATALIPTTLTLAILGGTGSAGDLGLVLACELIPLVLLLPVSGVVADRFRPERVARAADLVRALAQAAIAVLLLTGNGRIPPLAGCALVTGVGVAFGVPAVPRLVRAAVAAEDRLRVNTRLSGARSLAELAAPALAGGLILAAGPGWSSALTSVLFLASALTLGGVRTPGTAGGVRASFPAEIGDGWREARRHPWFLASVLSHSCWHLAAGFLLTLGPLIALRELGGEGAWVLVAQVGAAGMLAGIFAASRLTIRRPLPVVTLAGATYVLPLIAFAATAPTWVCAAAYGTAMTGLGLLLPLWDTEMQRRIPERSLGRVSSLDALISFVSRPVGLAAAAPLAALTATAVPLLAAAALIAVSHALVLVTLRRGPDQRDAPAADGRIAGTRKAPAIRG